MHKKGTKMSIKNLENEYLKKCWERGQEHTIELNNGYELTVWGLRDITLLSRSGVYTYVDIEIKVESIDELDLLRFVYAYRRSENNSIENFDCVPKNIFLLVVNYWGTGEKNNKRSV